MARKTTKQLIRRAITTAAGKSTHEIARDASELLPERVLVVYKEGRLRPAAESLYNLDLKAKDWTPVAAFEKGKRVCL